MYFRFTCPSCEKSLKVRPEHAGRRVACPYCRDQITIPETQDEIEDVQEYVEEASDQFGVQTTSVARSARAGQRSSTAASSDQWADGTNVSMLTSGLIGLGFSTVFYILLFPFAGTKFGELFFKTEAGWWVPPVLVFMMGWAVAILILKSRKLKRQKTSMLFDLLPTELGHDIAVNRLDGFIGHLRGLPATAHESFLVNRVVRGLEHFRVRKSAPEVATVMASQSEIDANSVDSSYTLLKVFIWAIPILGFIGTVVGISAAVGGFSGTLESADDISVLKESLNNVTGGLATAFDTTLVALVMSMLVMFPTSSLQKSEEDLLNWVDEYCNENLLKRLDDGREQAGPPATTPGNIKQAIDAAMADHHAELRGWTKKLDAIGQKLTEHVVQGWQKVSQDVQAQQQQNLERCQDVDQMVRQFQTTITGLAEKADAGQTQLTERLGASADAMLQAWGERLEAVGKTMTDQVVQCWDKVQQDLQSGQQQHHERLLEADRMVSQFQTTITAVAERADTDQAQLVERLGASADAMQQAWGEKLEAVGTSMADRVVQCWDKAQQDLQKDHERNHAQLQQLDQLVSQCQTTIAGLGALADSAQGEMLKRLRESADAMQQAWSEKLEATGKTMTGQVVQGWSTIQSDVQAQQKENLARLQKTDQIAGELQTSIASISQSVEAAQKQLNANAQQSAQAILKAWNDKLETVGQSAVSHLVQSWDTAQQGLEAQQQQSLARLEQLEQTAEKLHASIDAAHQKAAANQEQLGEEIRNATESMLRTWSDKLDTIGAKGTDEFLKKWDGIQQHAQQQQQESLARFREMDRTFGEFQAAVAGMSEQSEATQKQMAASLHESADALQGYVASLQRGLEGLSAVLSDLGEKQVLVQPAPRRGWFFGRSNGGK